MEVKMYDAAEKFGLRNMPVTPQLEALTNSILGNMVSYSFDKSPVIGVQLTFTAIFSGGVTLKDSPMVYTDSNNGYISGRYSYATATGELLSSLIGDMRFTVGLKQDLNVVFAGDDRIFGNSYNNIGKGYGGSDFIDGGGGVDTAIFSGSASQYSIKYTASTGVAVTNGPDGLDSMINVERLQFADKTLAFDISGNAGTTAKILGAVFGLASVSNKVYVGIGLNLLDGGMIYLDLMQLAINANLGAGASNEAVVNLLYTNVVGTPPPAADLAFFTGLLDSGAYTRASLGVLAADTALNTANVNLVGLATSGLEYLPWG